MAVAYKTVIMLFPNDIWTIIREVFDWPSELELYNQINLDKTMFVLIFFKGIN